MQDMKKCVVIYNPNSGKKEVDALLPKFEEIFNKYDYTGEIIFTEYKGHASEIVEKLDSSVDLVISIGGDGTFNESMRGNFNR